MAKKIKKLKISLNQSCLILILIANICNSCAEKKQQTIISQERLSKLSRATSFNEIFAIEDTIQLEVSPASLIAYLGVVAIDQNGRIAVSDERLGQILLFSSNGQFLKLIARKGSGPGEVDRPYGVAFSHNGDLGVIDVGNNRINIYNAQGDFKLSLRSLKAHPSRIILDSDGNVFVQDSGSRGRAIQKYDREGNLLNEFGQIPETLKKIGTAVRGGNFAVYKNLYIYYLHPTEYLTHQFTLDGKEVKTIMQPSNRFRPLKERLESADPQTLKRWNQSWDRAHSVLATNEGFLIIIYQATKLSLDTITNIIDLYDIEGNLIVENVPTSYLPVAVDDNGMIYCLNQELQACN